MQKIKLFASHKYGEAPQLFVKYNDTGASVDIFKVGEGRYYIDASSPIFKTGQTGVLIAQPRKVDVSVTIPHIDFELFPENESRIELITWIEQVDGGWNNTALVDNLFDNTFISIEIYK